MDKHPTGEQKETTCRMHKIKWTYNEDSGY